MSLKPRSQIGRINSAPLRSQNAALVAADGGENDAVDQNGQGTVRPTLGGRPHSFQSDAEGGKRRSLLPQPGQHKYNTRSSILPEIPDQDSETQNMDHTSTVTKDPPNASTPAEEAPVKEALPGRLRPRSMYQAGAASSPRVEQSDKPTTSRSMRPPAPVSRPAEPQRVGLGRTQSLRRPGATSQSAQTAGPTAHARTQSTTTTSHSVQPVGPAAHARTQSTSTLSGARREIAKPSTGSERPKSLLMAPSQTSRPNNVSADKTHSGARSSIRIAGLNRSASIKAKPEAPSGSTGIATAARPEPSLSTQAKRREMGPEEPSKTHRPAFSTLQQHFTPRKTGKAPTATFINPPPAPTSHSLPPEMASLQAELLQLHLLHRTAAQVSQRWERSAKQSLHTKFDQVATLYQVMLENERAGQEQKNVQALLEWSAAATGGSSSTGLIELIQILSGPLHELPSLIESGGRLQRLVAAFERWLQWVQDIRSARQAAPGHSGTIEGLGDKWKAENAALTRKLSLQARDLERLARPAQGSSIAAIVEACNSILWGILEELSVMLVVEAEVVAKEQGWVEDRLRVIARDVGIAGLEVEGQSAAAWRM